MSSDQGPSPAADPGALQPPAVAGIPPAGSSEARKAEADPAAATLPLGGSQPTRYTGRFAVAYVLLGITMAAAITGLIVLVIRPGHHAAPAWSTWKPTSGSTTAGSKQISDHVAHEYRLSKKGGQLLAVIPSKATVTSGTSTIQIRAVAVRKAPQSNTGIAIYDANKTTMFQLCGLGQNCSIASGQASATRGRLVRREALELALYTFKFLPSVDSIAAFMPPPPGQSANTMIYLQKSDLKDQLKQPLSETLSSRPTPLPDDADTKEAATIDKLTLPHLFTYSLTALQGGGAALILDPAQ